MREGYDLKSSTNARLVQRRYREFETLHAQLQPLARQAGYECPPLPSKFALAWSRGQLGVRRQLPLQRWLGWAAAQPELWCDELQDFLGLSHLSRRATPRSTPCEREAAQGTPDDVVVSVDLLEASAAPRARLSPVPMAAPTVAAA